VFSPPALFDLFLLHALGQRSGCLLLTIVDVDVLGLTIGTLRIYDGDGEDDA